MAEKAKRVAKMKKSVSTDGAVTFTPQDGTGTGDVKNAITIRATDFPKEMQGKLLSYGISQKFGDAYAGTKTVQDALGELKAMITTISNGEWQEKKEGSGPKAGATIRDLLALVTGEGGDKIAKALSITDATEVGCRDWFLAQSEETRKAITASPEIKKARATRLAAEADESSVPSLLSVLG